MTTERKQELIEKAAQVLTPEELKRYADNLDNIDAIQRRNDDRIARRYAL